MNNFMSEIETGFEEQDTKAYVLAKSWDFFSSLFNILCRFSFQHKKTRKNSENHKENKIYMYFLKGCEIYSDLPLK